MLGPAICNLPCDFSYAYDVLAINSIKWAKSFHENNIISTYCSLINLSLESQLGEKQHHSIMQSSEYHNLYNANLSVFELIDEIKARNPRLEDAISVDKNNYKRFTAKVALQQKFFPETVCNEVKIGYAT